MEFVLVRLPLGLRPQSGRRSLSYGKVCPFCSGQLTECQSEQAPLWGSSASMHTNYLYPQAARGLLGAVRNATQQTIELS